jgi:diacylglycerol kinase (ATP)
MRELVNTLINGLGLKRLYNAFFYSLEGFRAAIRTEQAFRQEVCLSVVLIPLGLWLGHSSIERALLAGTVLLVMIVELLNTAIERAIDRISYDRHQLSKESKDICSAAVLLSLIAMLVTWYLILV